MGEIAKARGARVLVDEVYLEAFYGRRPRPAFHFGDQFLVTSSLTKAFGLSGVRCGWVLADPEVVHRMWRINDLYAATPAHPAELISVIAFDHLGQGRGPREAVAGGKPQIVGRLSGFAE